MFRNLSVRLGSLFKRERLERELDAELRYHVDMLVEQNVARGMAPDAARREALRVFGTVAGVKDDVRDNWLSRFVEVAAQDIRYGMRSLRRNPGLRARHHRHDGARHRRQHRHLQRRQRRPAAPAALHGRRQAGRAAPRPSGRPDQQRHRVLGEGDGRLPRRPGRSAASSSSTTCSSTCSAAAEPERLSTGVVSANYFDVLGVQPLHGRTFVAADDAAGRAGRAGPRATSTGSAASAAIRRWSARSSG